MTIATRSTRSTGSSKRGLLDPINDWLGITRWAIDRFTTANAVTEYRLKLGLWATVGLAVPNLTIRFIAGLVLTWAWWLDGVDGSVARKRKEDGHDDDPDGIGAYLDAIRDKQLWLATSAMLVVCYDMSSATRWLLLITGAIEVGLYVVRQQDFRSAHRANRAIRSRLPGKIKMALEVTSHVAIIVANVFIGMVDQLSELVANTSLAIAIPFAIMSLIDKLLARRR